MYWNCQAYFPPVRPSLSACVVGHINNSKRPSLTSLSWLSTLAVGTRETWPAGWTLLALRSRGASPTRLTGRSGYRSD